MQGAWRSRVVAVLVPMVSMGALGTGVVAQEPSHAAHAPTTLTVSMDRAIDAATIEAAFDPDALRSWVAEQVTVDDGSGVRRGARGALLAMRGSEADRALLLAAMLERAGMPVRFALCDLPAADALAAGDSAVAGAAVARPALAVEYADELAAAVSDPELRDALYRVVDLRREQLGENEEAARVLADALRQVPPPEPAAEAAATSAAAVPRRHAWVQMAWGAEWRDMDLTSATGVPPCESDTTADVLPPELGERVRIVLWVERRAGDSLARSEALVHEALLADLATSSVAFAFGEPAGLIERPPLGAGALGDYTPVLLIDGEMVLGSAIALPPLHRQIGEAIGEGIDEVVDALDPSAAPEEDVPEPEPFTAAWLEIDLIGTDGSVRSLRSDVFDRIGIAARVAGEAETAEVAPLEVVAGEYADLGTWWQVGILLDEVSTPAAIDPNPDLDSATGLSALMDGLLRLYPAAYRDMGGTAAGPIVLLAGLRQAIGPDGPDGAPIDRVVLDALHVPGQAHAEPDAAARDAQAVLGAESFLAGLLADPVQHGGAAIVFAAARTAAVPLVMLTPGDAVSIHGASEEARARMALRLDAGHRLLVPASAPSVAGIPELAWWAVDPVTGVVRDEHESGRHATMAGDATVRRGQLTAWQRFRQLACRVGGPPMLAAALLYAHAGGVGSGDLLEAVEEMVRAAEDNAARGDRAREITCMT